MTKQLSTINILIKYTQLFTKIKFINLISATCQGTISSDVGLLKHLKKKLFTRKRKI